MLECRYKGQCRIEYDTDFDACYPCIGDWGDTCARYEPMPDVKALKGLADKMDRDGKMQRERQKDGEHWFIDGLDVRWYARRIREACGEVEPCDEQS